MVDTTKVETSPRVMLPAVRAKVDEDMVTEDVDVPEVSAASADPSGQETTSSTVNL